MWPGTDLASRAYLSYLRDLPAVRGKLRVGLAIAARLSSLGIRGENGARFELEPSDWISWVIAREGGYERDSLRLSSELLRGGGQVLDIGAAWGLYTCTLGVLPGVEVVSVEPTPRNFARLERNLALNPGVRARLYAVALASEAALVGMARAEGGNALTARVTAGPSEFHVPAITPRQLVEHAGLTRIKLMKIDVDGTDMAVARAFPWDRVRPEHVLFEIWEPYLREAGESIESVLGYFSGLGYRARRPDGSPYTGGQTPGHDLNIWLEAL